jgi:hypothetical protein
MFALAISGVLKSPTIVVAMPTWRRIGPAQEVTLA